MTCFLLRAEKQGGETHSRVDIEGVGQLNASLFANLAPAAMRITSVYSRAHANDGGIAGMRHGCGLKYGWGEEMRNVSQGSERARREVAGGVAGVRVEDELDESGVLLEALCHLYCLPAFGRGATFSFALNAEACLL